MRLELSGHTVYAYTGTKPIVAGQRSVMFIHGAANDHSVWQLQSRYFAYHGFNVLAVDLPAHGRSAGEPLGVAAASRWLVGLIEASGMRRVALVGHSMGSLIALEAAAQLRERASALVMVGAGYPMKVSPKLLALCQRDALAAIDLVNALSNSTHAAKPSHPGPGFSIHSGNRALLRRMQNGHRGGNLFLADFAACDAYAGFEAAAPQVTCPVTLVLGARDQMTPPASASPIVAALAPRVVTLPTGHNLMAEAPDGVLGAITDALDSQQPR
jgi:pimeloyl-ACP methyl ester carboxylesterase